MGVGSPNIEGGAENTGGTQGEEEEKLDIGTSLSSLEYPQPSFSPVHHEVRRQLWLYPFSAQETLDTVQELYS